jgi:hypothetical protein
MVNKPPTGQSANLRRSSRTGVVADALNQQAEAEKAVKQAVEGLMDVQTPRIRLKGRRVTVRKSRPDAAIPSGRADPKAVERLSRYLNEPLTSTSSPTAIAVRMWGPEAVALFLDQRDAVRYMYSPTNNEAQCIRAKLGNPNNPKEVVNMKCWLCGYGLTKSNGSKPDVIACEHVLPVYQAVMFADIALAKSPSTSTLDLIRAEYEWAHASCNGPKSNSVFIKEKRDGANRLIGWEVDGEVIKTVLMKTVPKIKAAGIDEGKLNTLDAEEKWVTERTIAITERMQIFLQYLNHPDGDTAGLMMLLAATKLGDSERFASKVKIDEEAYNNYVDRLIGPELNSTQGARRRIKRKRSRRFTRRK